MHVAYFMMLHPVLWCLMVWHMLSNCALMYASVLLLAQGVRELELKRSLERVMPMLLGALKKAEAAVPAATEDATAANGSGGGEASEKPARTRGNKVRCILRCEKRLFIVKSGGGGGGGGGEACNKLARIGRDR
eukprot:1160000-Pelagomonas_calceolata.AAC.12